jgi:hypothetical protein
MNVPTSLTGSQDWREQRRMIMDGYTNYLFARPSFLQGVARILDFGNHLDDYNTSLTPEDADEQALRNDWAALGEDFRAAADRLTGENL